MDRAARYHPVLVVLHWMLAILIVGELLGGFFVLAPTPDSDPVKVDLLRFHMVGGILILTLTVLRFIVRMATAKPPAATTGRPALDALARLTHYTFYVLVLLMAASGLATAVVSGVNPIVFGDSTAPLPPTLLVYPPRIAHGYFAAMFAALVALHVIAALYHQLALRDGLFGRVWFGARAA